MNQQPIDYGGTAYPFTPTDRSGQCGDCEPGMFLRDYFAAQALTGILSRYEVKQPADADAAAFCAYQFADAMLKARKQ